MDSKQFLEHVINDGIAAAKADYNAPRQADMLEGSIAGFEACRGKTPSELAALLEQARKNTKDAHRARNEDYWKTRCFELEVEWVCNCVSAILYNEGQQIIVPVTARGMMKAAEIVGKRAAAAQPGDTADRGKR